MFLQQLFDVRFVEIQPFRLKVRAELPTNCRLLDLARSRPDPMEGRALVESQAKPEQAIDNVFDVNIVITLTVGVFNAHNELPAMFFGKQIVEQCCASRADVKLTGWRRGNSNSYFLSHYFKPPV